MVLNLLRDAEGKDVLADTVARVKSRCPLTPTSSWATLLRWVPPQGERPVQHSVLRGQCALPPQLQARALEEEAIRDQKVLDLARRVDVVVDPAMELRGHTPVDMTVYLKDGREIFRQIEIAPGFPGNPLTKRSRRLVFATASPMPRNRSPWRKWRGSWRAWPHR